MRKKTSIIWSISKEELCDIVKKSNSLSKILLFFGLYNKGGNLKTLKNRLYEEDIDFSHISLGINSNIDRIFNRKKIELEKIMTENSTYGRGHLKERLLKEGILKNECSICGQKENWNDQELIMILDHINGISNDNRLENLRMLCPNCNSQQKTFSGRNRKRREYRCIKCNNETKINRKYCNECRNKQNFNKRKVERPSIEQLLKEIKETNYCAVGRKYGVSDNAIRKWVGIK
jgi:hypothetical protein